MLGQAWIEKPFQVALQIISAKPFRRGIMRLADESRGHRAGSCGSIGPDKFRQLLICPAAPSSHRTAKNEFDLPRERGDNAATEYRRALIWQPSPARQNERRILRPHVLP